MLNNGVSIVNCSDYDVDNIIKSIEDLLRPFNGLYGMIKDKKRVLIKVNMVGPYKPQRAATTHPAVVEAFCKMLSKLEVEILIGDSSLSSTEKAFEVCGFKEVAKKYGAKLCNFDNYSYKYYPSGLKYLPEIPISDYLFESDFIINIAKLKIHYSTQFTGTVKNLYGIIPGKLKLQIHGKTGNKENFENVLVQIPQICTPGISIIDGIVGMEGNGPTNGKAKHAGYLLGGINCYNIDSIAMDIIGIKQKEVYYINNAISQGLCNRIENIKVYGEKYSKVLFQRPSSFISTLDRVIIKLTPKIYNKFMRPRANVNLSKCKICRKCTTYCPENAIYENKGKIYVNKKKCISCFCCQEACPYDAIESVSFIHFKNTLKTRLDFHFGKEEFKNGRS